MKDVLDQSAGSLGDDVVAGRAPDEIGVQPEADSAHEPEIVIRPGHGWVALNLREFFDHRDLLRLLVWRNIKIRYKQTVLGAAWAVIPGVMTMVIFTVIFGHLAHLSSNGAPYALFSFCALVPWTYFSNAVTMASTSLVDNERLVTRVYFPRLFVPLSAVVAGVLDFVVAFLLLVLLAVGYHVYPTFKLLAIPGAILLATAAAFAVGMAMSAFNVFYRDVKYVITFLIQFWLFATPVAYSTSLIPHKWLALYALNPMVGVIDIFRWSMLENSPRPGLTVVMSLVSVAVLLTAGLFWFRRVEDSFADVV